MPIILPAHCIWDHDKTLKNTASTVVWPPKGWREMLFDRKKLTWEHAAMTLEPATNSLINFNWQLFLLTRKVHASSARDTWRRPTFRILNNEVTILFIWVPASYRQWQIDHWRWSTICWDVGCILQTSKQDYKLYYPPYQPLQRQDATHWINSSDCLDMLIMNITFWTF
jgi:hypothetical protein